MMKKKNITMSNNEDDTELNHLPYSRFNCDLKIMEEEDEHITVSNNEDDTELDHSPNSRFNRHVKRGTIILAAKCSLRQIVVAADRQLTFDIIGNRVETELCRKIFVTDNKLVIGACGDDRYVAAIMRDFRSKCVDKSRQVEPCRDMLKDLILDATLFHYTRRQYRKRGLRGSIFMLAGHQHGIPKIFTLFSDWKPRRLPVVKIKEHESYVSIGSGSTFANAILKHDSESFVGEELDKMLEKIKKGIFHSIRNDLHCERGIDVAILRFGRNTLQERIEEGREFDGFRQGARDMLQVRDKHGVLVPPKATVPTSL